MLEALLALSMLLLVGLALLNVNALAVTQHGHLQRNQCLSWLAENLLTRELLEASTRNLPDETGQAMQCDRTWKWHITRQKQTDSRFWMITLQLENNDGLVLLERKTLRAL